MDRETLIQKAKEPRYLGDGVYADYDGYHIRLRTGGHRNPVRVHLEPSVLKALRDYEERINNIRKQLSDGKAE